ncbi:MAG: oligoendopeptidase F [Christensenellaceae bacterium]
MLDRKDVPLNHKWATEDIYKNTDEWERDYESVRGELDFKDYENKLSDPDVLLSCYKKLEKVTLILEKLDVYAYMRHDENVEDTTFLNLLSRIENLCVQFSAETAFITPELTSLDESYIRSLINDSRFKDYDYVLKGVLRQKSHVLSKETESVLSLGAKVFSGYKDVFSMIENADLKFGTVKVDGEDVKLSHGMYSVLLQSPDVNVRRETFKSYYHSFHDVLNTISATYTGNVNKNVFISKARKYKSCLERALFNEDVDEKVYNNLIESVHGALPVLHEYVYNKKRELNLDEMHMYDMYVPIVEDVDFSRDYEEAFKLVKEGLASLGAEYQMLLQTAHDERWIDVEETPCKRSGAYSIHVYALKHPYVLLNYQKTTNDIFTIAHELGHAMHSYFSAKSQPQSKADYKIFVAEVASTVNEVLLLKYLVKTSEDKKLKKYLLSYYMDMIKGTLFRQTMFAEFEYIVHKSAENNEALTKDFYNKVYLDLNKKYYGDGVISDDEIAYEWCRIPHFYNAFYVYKYATGITSAINIAEKILSGEKSAVDDYFEFLSGGGSDSPVELLKIAGVNLMEKAPFEVALNAFSQALSEYKKL